MLSVFRALALGLLAPLIFGTAAMAATITDFSGEYSTSEDGEPITLSLKNESDGGVSGDLFIDGIIFAIHGEIRKSTLKGSITGADLDLEFSAQLHGEELLLTMKDPDDPTPEKVTLRRGTAETKASTPVTYEQP